MTEFNVSYTLEDGAHRRMARNLNAHDYHHAIAKIANYWLKKSTPQFAGDFKLEPPITSDQT